MTERIERLKTSRKAVAKETFRSRVHALYADVRSWLAGDDGFRFEQSPFTVTDALGRYEVDRLQIFSGDKRIADFKPDAATVVLAAGQMKVWGRVDAALLVYYESSPTYKVLRREPGAARGSVVHFFDGIDRPGWYWSEARHDDGARFVNARTLFDIFEEISDFERERGGAHRFRSFFVPQDA